MTQTFPDDLAAAISESDAAGVAGAFVDDFLDDAGAAMLLLAGADFAGAADVAGAGVELGAGVAAGAAIEFEPEPLSAAAFLLLLEDFVLVAVSVPLAPAESAADASAAAFLLLFDFDFVVVASGAAAAELSADIASLFFFLFEDFVPDAVSALAVVEESALAAFLLFFEGLVVVSLPLAAAD